MKNLSFLKGMFLFLAIAGVVSCTAQKPQFTIYQTQHWDFPFSEGFDKVLYKATVDVKDHHLTGILLAKRVSDTTVRIVFSNEVGMKFFDIEFYGEKSTVHYIFPSMDKKILVSILEDDMKMIFIEDFTIEDFKRETRNESVMYQTESARGSLVYNVDKETFRIKNISTQVKKVKKSVINFQYDDQHFPVLIQAENPFIGMKIQLRLLRTE